jgi:Signal transduction histidine kinase
MNSITKRWVRGNLLLTILVLVIAEIMLSFWVINSYRNSVRQAIMARMNTLSGQLSVTETLSTEERAEVLERTVTDFTETDKFELMLVGQNGRIIATSSGFMPGEHGVLEDFELASRNENGIGEFIGDFGQNEKVMAITVLLDYPSGDAVALRIVTSLSGVDRQVNLTIMASVFLVSCMLLFSVLSGLYFVRSIVTPVGKIEATATKIAAGDFGARIQGNYNDEIGRLGDTINHMAEELGNTEKMKNDFIASVSHELRTPLTSIKGWTETLAKRDNLPKEEYEKGINIIQSETDRLYNMVEELLDFSRIQNGGMTFTFEKMDVVAEVSDAVLMYTKRVVLEGKILKYEEQDLPAVVWGDKNRLRQVFINLLDNALKYTSEDDSIEVYVEVKRQVHIVVKDSGIGIEPSDLKRVKTKFFKGKDAVSGAGIGLALANEIVLAHGGKLTLKSEKSKGTEVHISLPIYSDKRKETKD